MSETTGVGAVSRAIELLRAIASETPQNRTLTALARRSGIKTPSAHHLLSTLVAEGLVEKDEARRYHFGPTLTCLAEVAFREARPAPALMLELRRLAELTGESAYLSGWVRDQIQILAEVSGTHPVRVERLERGLVGYEYARASGKMLLALLRPDELNDWLASVTPMRITSRTITDKESLRRELCEVLKQGYAVEKGQFIDDVACCAAPIFRDGLLLGVIGVRAPMARFDLNEEKLVAAVLEAAERASGGAASATPPSA